jgi:hypothetical protein
MAEALMVRDTRKRRRYVASTRLENFLRSKYLERSTQPELLMPSGVPFVFPLTSGTRVQHSDDDRGLGQAGAARILRAAAKLIALTLTLLLFGTIAFEGQAHAGQILADTGVFSGESTAQYSMTVSGAGTLSVNLIDYAWTSPLADLTLEIASPTQILGQLKGAGEETVSLSGAGTYYAYVTGMGTGRYDIGAYGLKANFQLLSSPTPVPLPGSISLLLGGVLVMMWSMRRNARPCHSPVIDHG